MMKDISKKIFHQQINYLFKILNDDIYNYWKGTKWDFNGTTMQPKKGVIACGYFVTNVLSQLGFELNRVKLAQVVSSKMIKTLCVDIHSFSTIDKMKDYLNTQKDSTIYIVGLDFHTGFILKENLNKIYFLHSNYINSEGVVKEKIDSSAALNSSKSFYLGSISNNTTLLKQWMK